MEQARTESGQQYVVKRGDTLYSIAFRYGLDFKELAQKNGIDGRYRIFVGQRLKLYEQSETTKPVNVEQNNLADANPSKSQNSATASQRDTSNITEIAWYWPHSGKIVRTFKDGSSLSKGVDLTGNFGDSVLAAASGTVVYAGNGLVGYGNLIIIEHSNSLLSAYANNQSILVNEKDKVDAKQVIATMGEQGDQPSLHFEIRSNGKPVDPLRYLPKR